MRGFLRDSKRLVIMYNDDDSKAKKGWHHDEKIHNFYFGNIHVRIIRVFIQPGVGIDGNERIVSGRNFRRWS